MEGRPQSNPGTDRPVRALSSAELLAFEREWLVEGRLPIPGSSILVAEPGTGAGALARRLALAVARGGPWLGYETRRGRALYVHVDGRLAALRASFGRLGLCESDDVHVLACPSSRALLGAVRERADALAPSLVVLDPLGPLLHVDPVVDLPHSSPLDRILDLAHEVGAHLMLVHRLRGECASETSATLASTSRDIDVVLTLTREAGRCALRRVRPGVDGLPVDPAELEMRVLESLRSAGRLLTQEEVTARVGAPRERVAETLAGLRTRGAVLRVGRGRRADPHRYTGCDFVPGARRGWLRRVRPWASLSRPS